MLFAYMDFRLPQLGASLPWLDLVPILVPIRERGASGEPVVGSGCHRLHQGELHLPRVRPGGPANA